MCITFATQLANIHRLDRHLNQDLETLDITSYLTQPLALAARWVLVPSLDLQEVSSSRLLRTTSYASHLELDIWHALVSFSGKIACEIRACS